jgi:hypothetical protein
MLFYNYHGDSYSPSWTRIITDRNYTSYTVTKTGGGASGTWGINISGTASKISNITTTDLASSSSTYRRIWFAYSDNTTGRPAYDDRYTIRTDIGLLCAPVLNTTNYGASAPSSSTAGSTVAGSLYF